MSEPLRWLSATASELHVEAADVRTIVLDVPGFRGHLAGQHVDIRLTADDGYVAQRSYSIASPAGRSERIALTVARVEDGEVSSFFLDELRVGDTIEVRGPIGGYFTWSPATPGPLMLVAGGSGVVPLMSMLRTRVGARSHTPARLLYSSRSERHIIYRDELDRMRAVDDGFVFCHTLTREVAAEWSGERGRIDRAMLLRRGFAPSDRPTIYVCGPTPFVESVAESLLAIGHHESTIRTERFGATGEGQ